MTEAQGGPPLREWATVEVGVLYRCQQPGYDPQGDGDAPHAFTEAQIAFLRGQGVGLIVSANEEALPEDNVKLLQDSGIRYEHFPVVDFTAPTREQVVRASTIIQRTGQEGNASLVYCGFGHGRTGTFVTAWEILTDHPLREQAASLAELCHANHVERAEQEALLERLDTDLRGLLVEPDAGGSDSGGSESDESDSSESDSDGDSSGDSESGDRDVDDREPRDFDTTDQRSASEGPMRDGPIDGR
ncbi:hypothetical protein [Actinosynnema sp. NPDC023587]|uniref:phosphatase domain-containing putative toxin n=1 Tax=Actinosynnema sp. NPDC023587 TaxID=3154695 RepID=UPI0033CF5A25